MMRACQVCGREFRAQRRSARFCSPCCRKRAQRRRDESAVLPDAPPIVAPGAGALAYAVGDARRLADYFGRLSAAGPAPARPGCARVRAAVEGALDAEGW